MDQRGSFDKRRASNSYSEHYNRNDVGNCEEENEGNLLG